jgi:hypothetical protein
VASVWKWNADGHTAAAHAAIKAAADTEAQGLIQEWRRTHPLIAGEQPYPSKTWLTKKPRPALTEMLKHGRYVDVTTFYDTFSNVALIAGGAAVGGAAALAAVGAIGGAAAAGGAGGGGSLFGGIGSTLSGIGESVTGIAGSVGGVAGSVGGAVGSVGSVVAAAGGILGKLGGHTNELSPVSSAARPAAVSSPSSPNLFGKGSEMLIPALVVLGGFLLLGKKVA